jgi:hypothetical protein
MYKVYYLLDLLLVNRLGDRIHSKTRRSQRGSSAGEMKSVCEFPSRTSVAVFRTGGRVGFAFITDVSALVCCA